MKETRVCFKKKKKEKEQPDISSHFLNITFGLHHTKPPHFSIKLSPQQTLIEPSFLNPPYIKLHLKKVNGGRC